MIPIRGPGSRRGSIASNKSSFSAIRNTSSTTSSPTPNQYQQDKQYPLQDFHYSRYPGTSSSNDQRLNDFIIDSDDLSVVGNETFDEEVIDDNLSLYQVGDLLQTVVRQDDGLRYKDFNGMNWSHETVYSTGYNGDDIDEFRVPHEHHLNMFNDTYNNNNNNNNIITQASDDTNYPHEHSHNSTEDSIYQQPKGTLKGIAANPSAAIEPGNCQLPLDISRKEKIVLILCECFTTKLGLYFISSWVLYLVNLASTITIPILLHKNGLHMHPSTWNNTRIARQIAEDKALAEYAYVIVMLVIGCLFDITAHLINNVVYGTLRTCVAEKYYANNLEDVEDMTEIGNNTEHTLVGIEPKPKSKPFPRSTVAHLKEHKKAQLSKPGPGQLWYCIKK